MEAFLSNGLASELPIDMGSFPVMSRNFAACYSSMPKSEEAAHAVDTGRVSHQGQMGHSP